VPVRLLGLEFAPGLVGLGFPWKKLCTIVDSIHLHEFKTLSIAPEKQEWVDDDEDHNLILS
jgi:hypothetical protein